MTKNRNPFQTSFDTPSSIEIAKLPATLALVGSVLTLALAIWALEKARSLETSVARSEAAVEQRE